MLMTLLEDGHLGGLRTGLTEDEVRALLGEPDDVGGTSRTYKRPNVWLYGTVEVYFSRERPARCTGVFWDASDKGKFRLIGATTEEDWPWPPLMPRADVEQWLRERDILFATTEPMADMAVLKLATGVRVTFHENCLTSMSYGE